MCNGTSKYIHENCLNQWIESAENNYSKTHCMECHFEYRYENNSIVYEKPFHFFSVKFQYFHYTIIVKIFVITLIYFFTYILDMTCDSVLLIHLINYNSNTPTIQQEVKSNYNMHYSYYKSASIFVLNYMFLIYYIQYIRHEINNINKYMNEAMPVLLLYIVFITHTQVIYNITNFSNNIKLISTYGNDTLDLINFFIWDVLIRIHENIVFLMNSNNGSNVILNIDDDERERIYLEIRNDDDNDDVEEKEGEIV